MQALSRQHRVWLAMLQVLLLLAAMAMPATAATNAPQLTGTKWLELLQTYQIVRGDNTGNLNLDQPISRAEMTTIMVRALGAEQDSKLYKGLSPFPDAKGHWADAEIAYAFVHKLVKGDGTGNFRPDDKITYAEALTMLLRTVGREPTTGEWPYNILLTAGELDLVPMGVTGDTVRSAAIRGMLFQSLAKTMVSVPNAEGKNLLQAHFATKAPTLSATVPATTETDKVRISGTVEGAIGVSVNGKEVSLNGKSFSTELTVEYGKTKVTVEAWDWANNRATYTGEVSREYPISSLNITGPTEVAPNEKAQFEITALDKDDQPVSLDLVTVKVEGNIGSFDKKSGVLTVANTPGVSGKITVSAGGTSKSISVKILGEVVTATGLRIQPITSVAYTRPMQVKVAVVDKDGNELTSDNGRAVTLKAAGLEGVTVSPATAYTQNGVATFTVQSTKMGDVNLTASASGLSTSTRSGTFGTKNRVRLVANPTTVTVGGNTTLVRVRAEYVDEDGNIVANDTGDFIAVEISSASNLGAVTESGLTINKGLTTSTQSGRDGMFTVYGVDGGVATITGRVITGSNMTVEPAQVTINVPKVGAGTKLQAYFPLNEFNLSKPGNLGQPAHAVVRLLDANGSYIPQGAYAFQVKVETSNGDPENVQVYLGDTLLSPLFDSTVKESESGYVVGRTSSGAATLKVYYNKPGRVTITPVAKGATNLSYDMYGEEDKALSSSGFQVGAATLNFTKDAAGVKVLATSSLGTDQEVAALSNSTSSTATLNVYLTDVNGKDGNWVPGNQTQYTVKLARAGDEVTTQPAKLTATTTDGKASFLIRGRGAGYTGMDTYTVTVEDRNGNPVTGWTDTIDVVVDNARPDSPYIISARGYREKDARYNALNEVSPDDDYLELVIDSGSTTWAVAKVFVENSSTPILTTDLINFSEPGARILVPKSKLSTTPRRYQVTLRNGVGESVKSDYSEVIVNGTYITNISISSAKYDGRDGDKKLIISGSGFSASASSSDTVDPYLMKIQNLNTGREESLAGAYWQINSNSTITLYLPHLENDIEEFFTGTGVRLIVESGWYVRANGQQASSRSSVKVTPAAKLHYAVLNGTRVTLYGEGFTTGAFETSTTSPKFKLDISGTDAEKDMIILKSPSRKSDSVVEFTLSSTDAAKIDTTKSVVRVGDGWFKDGTALSPAPAQPLNFYSKVSLRSVSYKSGKVTISGSAFDVDAQLNVGDLYFVDAAEHAFTTQGVKLEAKAGVNPTVTASQIVIELSGTAQAALETLLSDKTGAIFLQGVPGWTTSAGKPAAPIIYELRLP